MKKKMVNVLLSVAIVTAMIFSVTACGSKNDDAQNTGVSIGGAGITEQKTADLPDVNADADEDADADGTDDAEEDVDADGTDDADEDADADETDDAEETATNAGDVVVASEASASLEEWTKSDECAQFTEMMNAGLEGMEISFEVEGDTISMIFTMTDAVDVADDAESAMNAYFTSNSEIFEAIRDQLISETGNQNTVLKLVYRNSDDSEIFSMEF